MKKMNWHKSNKCIYSASGKFKLYTFLLKNCLPKHAQLHMNGKKYAQNVPRRNETGKCASLLNEEKKVEPEYNERNFILLCFFLLRFWKKNKKKFFE